MDYDKYMDKVILDDIHESYIDIVNIIGIKNFIELSGFYGGSSLYIPMKKNIAIPCRNRLIKEKFNGINYRDISKEFNVSINQIRNIVNNYR